MAVLFSLRWLRQQTKLCDHAEPVGNAPMFDYLVILEAAYIYHGDGKGFIRWRSSHE